MVGQNNSWQNVGLGCQSQPSHSEPQGVQQGLPSGEPAPHLLSAFFRWSPLTYMTPLRQSSPTLSTQSQRAHRICLVFNSNNTIFDFKERQLDHGVEEKIDSNLRSHFRNLAEIEAENCNAVQMTFSWVSSCIRGKKCCCPNQKCRTPRPCLIGEVKDTAASNKYIANNSPLKLTV